MSTTYIPSTEQTRAIGGHTTGMGRVRRSEANGYGQMYVPPLSLYAYGTGLGAKYRHTARIQSSRFLRNKAYVGV